MKHSSCSEEGEETASAHTRTSHVPTIVICGSGQWQECNEVWGGRLGEMFGAGADGGDAASHGYELGQDSKFKFERIKQRPQ